LLVTALVVLSEMDQAAAKSVDETKMDAIDGEATAAGMGTMGAEQSSAAVNGDRRLVIHNDMAADGQEEEDAEDEFIFDEDAPEEGLRVGFLAVARYYSSHRFPTRVLFDDLFQIWGERSARDLSDNRYLVEFTVERSLNFSLRGGPWTFKGDAINMVKYDGLDRISEVIIESIPLWIRIYDIPVAMLTSAFMSALGAKVGLVLEVGQAVKDFQRVRVDFALADALAPTVKIRVRSRGLMEFVVKYDSVPYFCFTCGRIGHAERECPDEDLAEVGARFGKELRASPFKRSATRALTFQAPAVPAKRMLNFSGPQKERAASFLGSSTRHNDRGSGLGQKEKGGGDAPATTSKAGEYDRSAQGPEGLMQEVKRMVMNSPPAAANPSSGYARETNMSAQKVSGLDSYNGSSKSSMEMAMSDRLSIQERLHAAKAKRGGSLTIKSPGAKKNKKVLKPVAIAQSFAAFETATSNDVQVVADGG
jgi:hypothetical protein